MSRTGLKITRDDTRVDWLDSFAEKFEQKSAVEVARERSQASISEQISAIMGGRNRYSSVEHAVQDMQERTGLKEYLNKTIAAQANREKVAALEPEKKTPSGEPKLEEVNEKLKESILAFIKNRAKTNNASVPSIQYEVLNQFKNQGLSPDVINTEEVARYINDLILQDQESKGMTNTVINISIGTPDTSDKDDHGDNDFLKGLMPATK